MWSGWTRSCAARLMAFEEAAGKIAAYLEAQVKQNALHQYLQILQERYEVVGLDALEAAA